MTQVKAVFQFTRAQANLSMKLRANAGRRDPLPRAVGLKPGTSPFIVDATAGLGRDALFLASLGADVMLIERVEEVYVRLRHEMDAFASNDPASAALISRMRLIYGDSKQVLPTLDPDVVLIDPMHPVRKKAALVKKEMRDLRDAVGNDEDASELIKIALDCARNRVVVKWPQKAPLPDGVPKPSHQIPGKTVRYDVFMTLRED